MPGHVFTGRLWEHSPDQPGSWHFVTLPPEVADDVKLEAGPRAGFGSIRVEARIGATTWRTSLFPDAASQSLLLPVKKSVRDSEQIGAGSRCSVTVTVDAARADGD